MNEEINQLKAAKFFHLESFKSEDILDHKTFFELLDIKHQTSNN
jgi:hypothetical protein